MYKYSRVKVLESDKIEIPLAKADSWNRTYNLPLTGRLLYQLSYVGIKVVKHRLEL